MLKNEINRRIYIISTKEYMSTEKDIVPTTTPPTTIIPPQVMERDYVTKKQSSSCCCSCCCTDKQIVDEDTIYICFNNITFFSDCLVSIMNCCECFCDCCVDDCDSITNIK